MTRKTALELAFAPDDYLVTWQIPSVSGDLFEAHGALTVVASGPPKGMAHGDFDHALEKFGDGGGIDFPQLVYAPTLTGRTPNGANVLLINARVTYWFADQAIIDAAAAIITLADVVSEGS